MQKEVRSRLDILDDNGLLLNSGWGRDDFFVYDRAKVKASAWRIKEWDFWEVFNDRYRVILNIFDIGYAGVGQFSFLDYQSKKTTNAMMLKPFTRGKVGNPAGWRYEKPLVFEQGKSRISFSRSGDNIRLYVNFPKKQIEGELELYKEPTMDSMVNVIPFANPAHFVYAVKVMNMPARGSVQIGNQDYGFKESNNSWGILDWTRAVFPYRNHWKWCTASGLVDGVSCGFNIDYGFGAESNKCMIVYDGRGHHLAGAEYQQDWNDLYKPLDITGRDNRNGRDGRDSRVNLTFKPVYAEETKTGIGLLEMKGIKVYGYFTGELVLDDGSVLQVKPADKLFGWAEEFYQRW